MDPKLPIVTAQTLEDAAALGLVPQRVVAAFAGSLGAVGLLLAAIGIYGVTAYTVARRTREIGIRVALGARRASVMGMVMRQGLVLVLIGCAAGLALAAAAVQILVPFLFGVPPLDPRTFTGATTLFVAAGLLACYIPARRATAVDPVIALHQD
jgi:ABC-type antimicrobial peptide transport system permease subunit